MNRLQAPGGRTSTAPIPRRAEQALPSLLHVEDFEPSRFSRTKILQAAGYQVTEADSAREALAATNRQRFAIALIDIFLPDSNGIALCDTLKRLSPDLPVVLISAAGSEETEQAALAAGAYGFLAEPVPADTLVRTVSLALQSPEETRRTSDTWVVTDNTGVILDASPLGAKLLSASPRGLHRRNLIVFFEQEREAWRDAMMRATIGERVLRSGLLRPKERRPVQIRVEIARAAELDPPVLLWSFEQDRKQS